MVYDVLCLQFSEGVYQVCVGSGDYQRQFGYHYDCYWFVRAVDIGDYGD